MARGTPPPRREAAGGKGKVGYGFSISSVAGTKVENEKRRAARANYGEPLKGFSSVCT